MSELTPEFISGIKAKPMCYSYEVIKYGKGNTVILNFTMKREGEANDDICQKIMKELPKEEFSFVNVYAHDWNRDYSPWEFKDEETHKDFAGEAKALLEWVKKYLLPQLKDELCKPDADYIFGGYSLAGLFVLWALYESKLFDKCVIGSASLWFPGFVEYVEIHELCKPIRIYMSLGIKEEKTRDRYMSQVGNATRKIYEILRKDTNNAACILEWNPGNHFHDTCGRMAGGYIRMIIGE